MTPRDWLIECVGLIDRQGLENKPDVNDAYYINMTTRKDAVERHYEADFVKYLMRALPEIRRLLSLPAASAHPGPAIRANAKEAGALDEVSK